MAWTKTDEESHIQPQIGEFVIWALAANKVIDTDMKFYICLSYTTLSFFFNGSTAPWGPRPPHLLRLHDHTQTHHSR
jgi:hypothetical protein